MTSRMFFLLASFLLPACEIGPFDLRSKEDSTRDMLNEDIEVRGEYRVFAHPVTAPPLWEAALHVTNVGDETIRGSYGGCAWELFGYSTPARTGEPKWRSRDLGAGCEDFSAEFNLAPGETHRFEVLRTRNAPALFSGPTYFTATFKLGDPSVRSRELRAGEFVP